MPSEALCRAAALVCLHALAASPALADGAPGAGGSADALVASPGGGPGGLGVAARTGSDGAGEGVRLSMGLDAGPVLFVETARGRGERGGVATLADVEHESEALYGIGVLVPLPGDRVEPLARRLRASALHVRASVHRAESDVTDALIVGERAARATIESNALSVALVATGEPGPAHIGWFGSLGLALSADTIDIAVDGPDDVGTSMGDRETSVVPTFGVGMAYGRGRWAVHAAFEQAGEPGLVAGFRIGY